jgi:hypothetical protein
VKFDRQMNLVWSHAFVGTGTTRLLGLSMAGNDVHVMRSVGGTLSAAGSTLTAQSTDNWLVGKLTADTGGPQWIRPGASAGRGYGQFVVADGLGVFIGGTTLGSPIFGVV